MPTFSFDAQVTAALFDRTGAIFALGDGSVRFENGARSEVHDGPILSAAVPPSGEGVVTGGDDSIAASSESGLIAFSAGRTLSVIDVKDAAFRRDFHHERTVSGVAFDPKGRRIATATYGGAWLWYARIEQQQPTKLAWAGSHLAVSFSPDGAFVVTSMQDAQLHGWRMKDQKNMRMGGYPSKVKSFAFMAKGQLLATSGAQGVVLWPFIGANGPMGREATEIGFDESTLIAQVAAAPAHGRLAAGLEDGRVWWADPAGQGLEFVKKDKGAPIVALAMSAGSARIAWADEDGQAGVVSL